MHSEKFHTHVTCTPYIAELFDSLGVKVSKDKVKEMFAEVDDDGSGEIDFEEFLVLVAKQVLLRSQAKMLLRADWSTCPCVLLSRWLLRARRTRTPKP